MTWLKIVIQTLTHLIGKKADKRDVEQLRRDTIPAPATASPGQTIVVKTVDDNGKPIEWEAGEAGGGLKTAIVKSSLYDAALAFVADPENATPPEGEQTYECINMAHAEAVEILKSGKPLDIQFLHADGPMPTVAKAQFVAYRGAPTASEGEDLRDAILIVWGVGTMVWTGAGFVSLEASAASEAEG